MLPAIEKAHGMARSRARGRMNDEFIAGWSFFDHPGQGGKWIGGLGNSEIRNARPLSRPANSPLA